jgi:hypothetical protein
MRKRCSRTRANSGGQNSPGYAPAGHSPPFDTLSARKLLPQLVGPISMPAQTLSACWGHLARVSLECGEQRSRHRVPHQRRLVAGPSWYGEASCTAGRASAVIISLRVGRAGGYFRWKYPSFVGVELIVQAALLHAENTAITAATLMPIARPAGPRPNHRPDLWRGYATQCIDRIFSCTGNEQEQEASHNTEVFVKALHAGDAIRA